MIILRQEPWLYKCWIQLIRKQENVILTSAEAKNGHLIIWRIALSTLFIVFQIVYTEGDLQVFILPWLQIEDSHKTSNHMVQAIDVSHVIAQVNMIICDNPKRIAQKKIKQT